MKKHNGHDGVTGEEAEPPSAATSGRNAKQVSGDNTDMGRHSVLDRRRFLKTGGALATGGVVAYSIPAVAQAGGTAQLSPTAIDFGDLMDLVSDHFSSFVSEDVPVMREFVLNPPAPSLVDEIENGAVLVGLKAQDAKVTWLDLPETLKDLIRTNLAVLLARQCFADALENWRAKRAEARTAMQALLADQNNAALLAVAKQKWEESKALYVIVEAKETALDNAIEELDEATEDLEDELEDLRQKLEDLANKIADWFSRAFD